MRVFPLFSDPLSSLLRGERRERRGKGRGR
jgi:hypothetical protein